MNFKFANSQWKEQGDLYLGIGSPLMAMLDSMKGKVERSKNRIDHVTKFDPDLEFKYPSLGTEHDLEHFAFLQAEAIYYILQKFKADFEVYSVNSSPLDGGKQKNEIEFYNSSFRSVRGGTVKVKIMNSGIKFKDIEKAELIVTEGSPAANSVTYSEEERIL